MNFNELTTLQQYDYTLAMCRDLMQRKNTDYGDSWRIMRVASITDQIRVKAERIATLEESPNDPQVSEGIVSEYRDILNYCVFALIKLHIQETQDLIDAGPPEDYMPTMPEEIDAVHIAQQAQALRDADNKPLGAQPLAVQLAAMKKDLAGNVIGTIAETLSS